ncbi:MAG: hypothetical protein HY900_12020, partial [Deltaproteobacteria bacterium]|nr:hypothetical protein [Deltaproteobacteria bacterium]
MNERRILGTRARVGGFLLGAVVAGVPALLPAPASAGLNATVETTFARSRSTLEGQGDVTSESDTSTILGRLYLAYLGNLYPYVTLRLGGTADTSRSNSTYDGTESDSTVTHVNPYLDLSFNNPAVHGGLGYNRRQEWQETGGSSSPSLVRESVQGLLGFKPEGLPTLDLQLLRTDTFDAAREQNDQRVDHVAWSSRYQPIPELNLSYQGTHNRTQDLLRDLEVIDLTNSARASYGSRFLGGRVNLNSSYGVSRKDTDTRVSAGGEGEVSSPLFPFGGLTSLDASPEAGGLDTSRALVDGDLAASTGVNLGTPPIGGDATARNLGLDQGGASDVNTLRVWVDREVTPALAASLSWAVWVSADNETWRLHQTVGAAPFGPFENRFELRFATVRTRFVKVVVKPLSPTVPGALEVPSLFVTELQAFLTVSAQQVRGSTTRTSQIFDLGVRALLLEGPALNYDVYYLYAATTPDTSPRQTVTNGLSAARRLSPILLGTARLSREDSIEPQRRASAWTYNASLAATPLETLSHTLVFSGRREDADGET